MEKIILLIIIIFSASIRLIHLDRLPPSLFSDEVDAAYQSFVFNNCSTDFYGNKFPTHFHSYSDWRTPLYIYSVSLSQKIFGLNEFSTRFPAALFGIISIFALYLLIKNLYGSKVALFSAFILCLSPWHIHYSRSAFETTGMLAALIFGLYFYVRFVDSNQHKHLLYSLLFLILSVYFYSTAKLYVLFIFISIFILWSKRLLSLSPKTIIFTIVFVFLISFPLLRDTIQSKAGYRFSYINIFSDPTVPQKVDYLRQQDAFVDHVGGQTKLKFEIVHNKFSSWAVTFINNYLKSFSSEFLFISGDTNLRHSSPLNGQMLYLDFFFIIFGFCIFLKSRLETRKKRFILLLLALSPMPFALTRDSDSAHSTRLILMLPFLTLYIALFLKRLFSQKILFIGLLSLYLVSFCFYFHNYYYHYPHVSAAFWHVGTKQAVMDAYSLSPGKIFFSSRYENMLPFFLFWNRYLPAHTCNIESTIKQISIPSFTGKHIDDKYYFGQIEWNPTISQIGQNPDSVFVVSQTEMETIRIESGQSGYQVEILRTIELPYEQSQDYIIFKFIPR